VLGLLIPFYNLYLVYHQFKLIQKVMTEKGVRGRFNPGIVSLFYIVPGLLSLMIDKLPYSFVYLEKLLYLIPLVPLYMVQKMLNEGQDFDLGQQKTTVVEILLVIVGLLVFIVSY
jgi:hypothetical protein